MALSTCQSRTPGAALNHCIIIIYRKGVLVSHSAGAGRGCNFDSKYWMLDMWLLLNVPGGLCISFCNFDSYDEDDKYFIRLAPLMAPQQRETVIQSRARGREEGEGNSGGEFGQKDNKTLPSCHFPTGGGRWISHLSHSGLARLWLGRQAWDQEIRESGTKYQ